MKTLEYNRPNLPGWDRFNNWLAKDMDQIRTIWAKAHDSQGTYIPENRSLFYNGLWMLRIIGIEGSKIPLGIFLHIRLAAGHKSQFGAGWKLNGRFTVTFRPWHSDANSAIGTHGPNVDQAFGWNRGTA